MVDLDLVKGKLTIQQALQRTKRQRSERDRQAAYSLQPPKTASSRRTIEIPPVTVEALRRHQGNQEELKAIAGKDWSDSRLVFTTAKGTPLDTSNILHHFQEVLKTAGLPRVRFYDLRHTHASLLIAEGVHPKKIAERLGHSSITLTMDTYGHLFDGSDNESAERMERLFGAAKPSKSVEEANVTRIDQRVANRRTNLSPKRGTRERIIRSPFRIDRNGRAS